MSRGDALSDTDVTTITPNDRKQEYYFALDEVLPEVMEVVEDIRGTVPDGIAQRDEATGVINSGLDAMQDRLATPVAKGNFWEAMYWVHNSAAQTIDAATKKWLDETDRSSEIFRRINQLVGDPYKQAYGERAIERAISSAALQTVFISCGFQKMVNDQFAQIEKRPMLPDDVTETHANNLRLATPLTRLHYVETGYIIALLEPKSLPGGQVYAYANNDYFTYRGRQLHPKGALLAHDLITQYPEPFPDGRIGCPGRRYIPEIWSWLGNLTGTYAAPALDAAGSV